MNIETTLEKTVQDFLTAQGVLPDDRVVTGLSGGLDSIVLLHLLHQLAPGLRIRLSAVHVHHGLSSNADHWLAFCADTCKQLGIPFTALRVQIENEGQGIEAAARKARYRAFKDFFDMDIHEPGHPNHSGHSGGNWLALAHHSGDRVETMLFNLFRGSGIGGIAGMPSVRPLQAEQASGGVQLLRPLLSQSREILEAYTRKHHLEWIEDESNNDLHYTRNFLRHEILPRLKTVFPSIEHTLTRASEHFSQANHLLHELALIDRHQVCNHRQQIDTAAFSRLSEARACNLLRYEIHRHGQKQPGSKRLREIVRQLRQASAGDLRIQLTLDNLTLRCWRGAIYFSPEITMPFPQLLPQPRADKMSEQPWANGLIRIEPVTGEGIRVDAWSGDVWLGTRNENPGARLRLSTTRPSRSLKQLMQEANIPPWERSTLPMLRIDGKLAWIADIGIDSAFACPAGETGIKLTFERR